jgi:CHAT domain-containing protein
MRIVCVGSALVLLGVAGLPQAQSLDERAAIEALITTYLDAIAKNDLKTALACWAADAPKEQVESLQQTARVFSAYRFQNVRLSNWTTKPLTSVRLRTEVEWKQKEPEINGHSELDKMFVVKKEKDVWRFVLSTDTVEVVARALEGSPNVKEAAESLKVSELLQAAGLLKRLIGNAAREYLARQLDQGDKWLSMADTVTAALGEAKAEGFLWLGKGQIQMLKGEYVKSEKSFKKSLEVCKAAKDMEGQYKAHYGLWKVYYQKNDIDDARSEAGIMVDFPVAEAFKLPFYLENAYYHLGPGTSDSANIARIIADGVLDKAPNLQIAIEALKIRALAFVQMGEPSKAQKDLDRAIQKAEEVKWIDKRLEIQCHLGSVKRLEAQSKLDGKEVAEANMLLGEARVLLAQTVKAAQERHSAGLEWRARVNLAQVLRAQKEYMAAVESYEKADPLLDGFRAALADPFARIGFEDQIHGSSFFDAIGCCHDILQASHSSAASRDEALRRAYEMNERARSRTLSDVIASDHFFLHDLSVQEKQKLLALRLAMVQTQSRLNDFTSAERDPLQQSVEEAKQVYEDYLHKLFQDNPNLKTGAGRFDPAPLTKVAEVVLKPFSKAAILSYLVGKDQTFLLVLSWDDAQAKARVEVHPLPVKREALANRVQRFRHLINIKDRQAQNSARQLYDDLVKPAKLAGKSQLIILADDVLHILPFAALRDADGKYLIENYSLSYAPSLTILTQLMSRDRDGKAAPALVMGCPTDSEGNPAIPSTEGEARMVAGILGTKAYVKDEATAALARKKLQQAGYIHLAVHGKFVVEKPLYSSVILARLGGDDGHLYAHELLGMELQARLVVLSACETAAPNPGGTNDADLVIDQGEGVVGLSWALFAARSPAHLLTLWNVGDNSSASLMGDFYKAFAPTAPPQERTTSRAVALQRAQLKLLNSEKYQDPYYWAPYAFYGDFR